MKEAARREAELERKERELAGKKNLNEYEKGDGFVVDDEEDEAEILTGDDDLSGGDDLSVSESEEEERPKKKSKPVEKKKKKSKDEKPKKKKKSKGSDSDSEPLSGGSGAEEDEEEDDALLGLDLGNIIETGRRTRGKRIDFTQFGPDGSDDDE